ncbi:2,4-dienoyl-CoA reductase-like NADH-dependent reductase (Old Yellow Enzyme family) [Melghirimyces profundicolus]|uniref:2,4-dienoyl-CoA reductase-like NADH-dependent reductase (Old Yellow Enzyme family) n=1 Tax=Melghirimyces profundicolus TaxID=1242148 RepID=A0A2T6C0F1_9BACL|nr:NADH:flavin oxidoreductase/NADH oxidase [Melghirimyces profundicolus]PTX61788.1 2,4-dienoyl-CoA reductase-like NADH-dependent reductase (Old Yellow Enzyme family) [Melghirimyces profundicolus]
MSPHLFSTLSMKGITLRNRIGVSPMCQYSAEDGTPNDWHLVHLGSRAVGGAGLVIAEATAVEARGRISPEDLGIYKEEHIPPFRRITDFIRKQGAVPGIQLAHAGRKASTYSPWKQKVSGIAVSDEDGGWEVVGPSSTPFSEDHRTPRELSSGEIAEIQEAFRLATARAREAGFEWMELHGAHGYLAHSFYSPLSNQRTDRYGGNFENRIRFLVETARLMRKEWPEELPFTVRLSCSDWVKGGWTLEDSVDLAKRLKEEGVDLIDCSSGGNTLKAPIPVGAGYQVPFAETIRCSAGIATAAVGLITQGMQADEIIRNGRADLVLLAREMLRDPYWPLRASRQVHQEAALPVPPQYERGWN